MLHPRANAMLAFALPALIIGSASSLVLLLVIKLPPHCSNYCG